ncbi:hypothetical protein TCAL_10229 [Tigriopus californicus]|uniref:C2H2-type domain-containing protein n=1 Tax=Tigriopus californicus TaxID=6832 RepID=A0A553NUP5_TIGCA|nr:hypothetical protein TCAL_10229 [Tigriopus californicus]
MAEPSPIALPAPSDSTLPPTSTTASTSKWKASYDSKRRYQSSWALRFKWIARAEGHSEHAYCLVCHKTLFPKLSVLQTHDRGNEHIRRYNASTLVSQPSQGAWPDPSPPQAEQTDQDQAEEDGAVTPSLAETPLEPNLVEGGVKVQIEDASGMIIHTDTIMMLPPEFDGGTVAEGESFPVPLAALGSQNVIQIADRPKNVEKSDDSMKVFRKLGIDPAMKRELLSSETDTKVMLHDLAQSVSVETLLEAVGPVIFEQVGLWDLMMQKAKLDHESANAMEAVIQETEQILAELKLLLENCFEFQEEVQYGRGERVKRKTKNGVTVPQTLATAMDLAAGNWRQKYIEDIKNWTGPSRGILLNISQVKDEAPVAPAEKPPVPPVDAMIADKGADDLDPEFKVTKPENTRKKRRMSCGKCGKMYRFKESLRKHEESCAALLRYKKRGIKFFCMYKDCSIPTQAFVTKEDLVVHFDQEHFEDKDRTIGCSYEGCPQKFATISLMNGHVRKCHQKRSQCLGKESTLCRKCGKMLSKNYMLTHESRCDGLFVRHPQWKKQGDEYICTTDGCSINHGFTCLYGLRVHFQSTHLREDEMIYGCEFCEERFPDKISRNKHVKQQHVKPYQCDNCGRRFGARSKLESHRLTQTGEKPFHCDRCEYRTAKKYNLDEHKQKKHNDLGGRNYYCGLCGKVFITPGRLTSHFRIVHEDGKNPEGTRKKTKPLDKLQPMIVSSQPQIIIQGQDGIETPQVEQEIAVDFITTTLKHGPGDSEEVEFTMV